MTSSVPLPVRSAMAMPGQTRLLLGPRHLRVPVAPFKATTSYEPQTTSGKPSPSRSATAGEEYQPVWDHELKQPPFAHLRTGALTTAQAGRAPAGGPVTRKRAEPGFAHRRIRGQGYPI